MVDHSGAGPDPSRDSGHAVVAENREQSSGASRFGAVRETRSPARPPARPPARRSPRDSRNIAVALALVAFAVIMFLVTIVKFDEQIQRIGMSQTQGATTTPRAGTSYRGSGVAAVFCAGRARAWGPAPNPGRLADSNWADSNWADSNWADSNGMVADFGWGGDRVDYGDGAGIAAAAGPCSGRPEEPVAAVSMGRYQHALV